MQNEGNKMKQTYGTTNAYGKNQTQGQSTQTVQRKMKEECDLPPIVFFEKPKTTQQEYFTFNFSKGTTLCRMKQCDDYPISSQQPVEKVVDSSDELVTEQKDQQKVERSVSENSMECEEQIQRQMIPKRKETSTVNYIPQAQVVHQTPKEAIRTRTPVHVQQPQQQVIQQQQQPNRTRSAQNVAKSHAAIQQQMTQQKAALNAKDKKPKLRIQTNPEKKTRPLIPIKPSKPTDPNVSKRREMIKSLRAFQRQTFNSPMKNGIPTQNNETRIKVFMKDLDDYCSRNGVFNCESRESGEIVVFINMFGEKRLTVLFNMNESNYENWSFPKPRTVDGRDVCDKLLMDRMKRQPTIETFMSEVFRVATAYLVE